MINASPAGDAFVAAQPTDRQPELQRVRAWLLQNLPEGYEESAERMLAYIVPRELFPAGYHCNPKQPLGVAWLAVNKNGFSLHFMPLYGNPAAEAALREEFAKVGKKLDMGQACIRFRQLGDLNTAAVEEILQASTPAAFIAQYQKGLAFAAEERAKRSASTAGSRPSGKQRAAK